MTMVQSGRPAPGSLTGRVWEIADKLHIAKGEIPKGRDVVDAYMREDPSRNSGTGFTQYSHWKKAHTGNAQATASDGKSGAVTIGPRGEVALPQNVLQALGLSVGDRLVVTHEAGVIRLMSANAALTYAQQLVRAFDKGNGSPVDELIADRRREAGN